MAQQSMGIQDWLLLLPNVGVVVGGGFAFIKYLQERQEDRRQRLDELEQRRIEQRWRQVQAAKQLIDEALGDPHARAALLMLDSWSREFEVARERHAVITAEQWLAALQAAPDTADNPKETFVRDSFDRLFYHMGLLEHYITRELVRFEDVRSPFDYYIQIMAEDRALHAAYMKRYKFERGARFLERFEVWGAEGTPLTRAVE